MKKRTIIYVFGPKRLEQSYRENIPFPNDYTGWLKIGLTTSENDTSDKWDVAIQRIKQESRTGLSEPCVLFDVFEYPYLSGKADDDIRWKMTSGIVYNLPNSKANNKLIKNRYEIRAGQEFVYGASRNQLLAAIAIFERELIFKFRNTDTFDYLMDLLDRNTMEIYDEQEDKQPERQQPLIDSFYEKLKSYKDEELGLDFTSPKVKSLKNIIEIIKDKEINEKNCGKLLQIISDKISFGKNVHRENLDEKHNEEDFEEKKEVQLQKYENSNVNANNRSNNKNTININKSNSEELFVETLDKKFRNHTSDSDLIEYNILFSSFIETDYNNNYIFNSDIRKDPIFIQTIFS